MSKNKLQSCPCNEQVAYTHCCQPYHLGQATPNTAEKLMRSRYSAYALKDFGYVAKTWHSTTKPNTAFDSDTDTKWVRLKINKAWDSKQPNEAFVEFTAKYKVNGKAEKMHEVSRFIKENEQWFYIDGVVS